MLLTLLLACSSPAPQVAAEPAPAAVATAAEAAEAAPGAAPTALVNLGEPFADTDVVPIDQVVAASTTFDGKPVIVEAVVKEVCQKKGCWHTLATSDPAVSVMSKDKEYKIFLPKDAAGKKVHVKGTFAVSAIPEDEARHYAEDAGRDPSTIVGPQRTFTLDVDGVRFL